MSKFIVSGEDLRKAMNGEIEPGGIIPFEQPHREPVVYFVAGFLTAYAVVIIPYCAFLLWLSWRVQ